MENRSIVIKYSSTNQVFIASQGSLGMDTETQDKSIPEDLPHCSLVDQANNAFDSKHYKKALNQYKEILKEDENNIQALQRLSLCHFYLKQYEEGAVLMQKAIEKKPQNLDEFYYLLGCAYCDQKQFMQGLVYLEKAITQNQKHGEALFMLGNAYQNISCNQIAISYYKKSIDANPLNDRAYFQIGETYFKMQIYPEAINAYKEACKINSENHYFFVRLGNSQWKNKNLEDAIQSFERATEVNKKFSEIGKIFSSFKDTLFADKNKLEKCIEYYLKLFALNPSKPESFIALGRICQLEKSYTFAKDFFEIAVRIDDTRFEGLKALGHTLILLKQYKKANQILEAALKQQTNDADLFYDNGCCQFELGNIQEASKSFRKALRMGVVSYEDIDDYMINKGILLQGKEETSKFSIQYFNFALLVNNNNAEAKFQKGKIYEKEGDLIKARKYFEGALQISPDEKNYLLKVEQINKLEREEKKAKENKNIECKDLLKEAKEQFNLKEYQRAIELLEKVLEINPNYTHVQEILGFSFEQRGEFEKAIQCYEKFLESSPEDEVCLFNLGNCLFRVEKYDEAIVKYNLALKLNPTKVFAFENLGACYLEKGQFDLSISNYLKALEYNPQDPFTNYGLGKAYFSNNQFEDALKCFQITLNSDSTNGNYITKMANTITMIKNDSIVGKIFLKNQHFTRNDQSHMDSLIAGVFYEMKEYEKSIAKCDQALQQDSHNFNAHLIKAASLKELQLLVNSLNSFEEALKINPNDPDCYFFYGQTLEMANLHMKALQKYDKSIMLASQISKNQQNFNELKQFQAAKNCFEVVLQNHPTFENYFNEIGNNLFEKNDYYGAIECYKLELKYNENDYTANYNMGMCFKNIEKINEAIACFQKNIVNKHKESCLQMSKSTKISYEFVEKLKLVSVSSIMDLQSLIRLELQNKDNFDPKIALEKLTLIKLVSQMQQIVSKKAINYEEDIMRLGQLNRVEDLSKVYKILLLTGLEEQSIVVNVKPELMLVLIGQQLIFFNNSVNLFYNPLRLFENILLPIKTHLKDVESFQNLGNGGVADFKQNPLFPQQICFLKAIISQCLSKLKNKWRYVSLCMNFKISSVYKIHFFQSIFKQKNFKPFLKIQKIENIFSNQSTNVQKINLRVDNSHSETDIILKTIKSKNYDEAVKEYTFQNCITHRNIHSSYFFYWNEDSNIGSIPQPLKEKNLFTIEQISYEEFLSIMLDCCEGLQQLTFFNIVHADIKPQNIFYDQKRAQIADFGSCIVSNTQNNEYTPTFCSPESESFESGQRITTSSDIYSLGKTFQYLAEKFQLPCSSSIQTMILLMLEKEPTKRIRVHEQIKIIQCEIFIEYLYKCLDEEMSQQRFYQEINYIIELRKNNFRMKDMIIDMRINKEKIKLLVESNKLFIRSLFNQKYLYIFMVILNQNGINEVDLGIKQKIDSLKEEFVQEAVQIEQQTIEFLSKLELQSPQEQYLDFLFHFNYEEFLQSISFFDNINYQQAYLLSMYLIWKTNIFNIEYPEHINNELRSINFSKLFKSFYRKDSVNCINSIDRQLEISSLLIEGVFNTTNIQNKYKDKYESILRSQQQKLLQNYLQKKQNLNQSQEISDSDKSDMEEVELDSINGLSAASSSIKDNQPSNQSDNNQEYQQLQSESNTQTISQGNIFDANINESVVVRNGFLENQINANEDQTIQKGTSLIQ